MKKWLMAGMMLGLVASCAPSETTETLAGLGTYTGYGSSSISTFQYKLQISSINKGRVSGYLTNVTSNQIYSVSGSFNESSYINAGLYQGGIKKGTIYGKLSPNLFNGQINTTLYTIDIQLSKI